MNRCDGGSLRLAIKEQLHLFVLSTVLHSPTHKIQHCPSFQMQKFFRKKNQKQGKHGSCRKLFALSHKQCFNLVKHIFLSCQLQNRLQFYYLLSRPTLKKAHFLWRRINNKEKRNSRMLTQELWSHKLTKNFKLRRVPPWCYSDAPSHYWRQAHYYLPFLSRSLGVCLYLMGKAMSLTPAFPQPISQKMYLAGFRHTNCFSGRVFDGHGKQIFFFSFSPESIRPKYGRRSVAEMC